MTEQPKLSKYWMLTNEYTQNPYPVLELVRAQGPVCELSIPGGGRAWVVTRHEEAKAALADPRLSRDIHVHYRLLSEQAGYEMAPPPEHANHLANLEPPRHTPLRRAISANFTPRRANSMRERIEQIADELLDTIAADVAGGAPGADLIAAYADPLPVIVIAELMGVPVSAWPDFLRWSNELRETPADDPAAARTVKELSSFMSALIAEKEREPGEDLISALVHAQTGRLTPTEILSTGFALMTGGNDTTASLIGGVLLTLLTHPDERAGLLAEPGRWGSEMDELVRFVSPITNTLQRATVEPVEIGGVHIPAGETVIISAISTNRDSDQFPDRPNEFDPSRPKPSHLSFGHGIHFCSGAHLAKLMTEVAARKFFARFPDAGLAVEPTELRYRFSMVVRPLEELPVRVS